MNDVGIANLRTQRDPVVICIAWYVEADRNNAIIWDTLP